MIFIARIIESSQDFTSEYPVTGTFSITRVTRRNAINNTTFYEIEMENLLEQFTARRFTKDQCEFESLKLIYVTGNTINIEGVFQKRFEAVKIYSEHIMKVSAIQNNLIRNEKLEELIKISKLGTTVLIKTYVNDLITPVFYHPSKKKFKKLKKFFEENLDSWPEEMRGEILGEFHQALERFKGLQPAKWKKWGGYIYKILSLIR